MAVVGGFVSAGVPLLLSSKIANAIAAQFEFSEVPTGLKQMSRQLSTEEAPRSQRMTMISGITELFSGTLALMLLDKQTKMKFSLKLSTALPCS